MEYRSVADLNATIVANLHRLPRDVDLVVGVPRSGLLAASLLALALNLPLADVDGFAAGRLLASGRTRRSGRLDLTADKVRHALIVDDSIDTGRSLASARSSLERLEASTTVTYCAVYGTGGSGSADLVLEVVPQPRVFEWNVMHHETLEASCVDIDGVLCLDPDEDENDDGPAYLAFLAQARSMSRPTRRIGTLVTSRLEKYRPQTEAWLAAQAVAYDRLVMLDLPDAATRRRLGAHASFKGEHYRRSSAVLFIESECDQARQIAAISGKDVLCMEDQALHRPGAVSPVAAVQRIRRWHPIRRAVRSVRSGRARTRLLRLVRIGDRGSA